MKKILPFLLTALLSSGAIAQQTISSNLVRNASSVSGTTVTDALNNVSTGGVSCARMPALTGAVTTSAGSCATSAAAIPTTSLTGTLQSAQVPAFTGDMTNTAGSLATTVSKFNGGTSFGSAAGNNTGVSVVPVSGALEFVDKVQTQVAGASKTYTTSDLGKWFSRTNSGAAMTDTMPTIAAANDGQTLTIANDDTVLAATNTLTAAAGQTFVSGTGGTGASTFVLYFARRALFVAVYNGGTPFWRILTNNNNLGKIHTGSTAIAGDILKFGSSTATNGNEYDDSGFSFPLSSSALGITTTTCTNQFVTAISAGGVGTCTTDTLASAQHANQGTTTTVLHGNAAGNPSFTSVTNSDLANASAYTLKGNPTSGSAAPTDTQAPIVGTPGFTAAGLFSQYTGTNASFMQFAIQNTNSGSGASTDFIASNDQGTDTTHYVDLGINSSTFSGTGSLNLAGAGYLYSATGDLAIGTLNSNALHFSTNSAATDALTINTSNAVVTPALTGYLKGAGSSAVTAATQVPISTDVSGLGTGIATWLATPSSANLASALTDETGSGAAVFANTATMKPKDVSGRVYVDCANTNGWSGSDFGAWVNSAYAYIHTTYTDTNGGIIVMAPGSCSFSTPIVLCNAGLMSIQLIGAGDGNGATILNYTATTGTAISYCGGSGNDGGVQLADFTITGTAQGNGATAISVGVAGTGGSSGSIIKGVSIRRFTTGINWPTTVPGASYGVNLYAVQVQQCTTGLAPYGENNVLNGGMIGNNATGMALANGGTEVQLNNVAFDDNTVTAINQSVGTDRISGSARFENAGGGTDTYITLSAGAISLTGGYMGTDSVSGTSTGFIQQSGGVLEVFGTVVQSPGRTVTQIVNTTGTAYATVDFKILPGAVGILASCTASFAGCKTPVQSNSVETYSSSSFSQVTVAGTDYYPTAAQLKVPAAFTPGTGIRVGTTYLWHFFMTKSAAGTGTTPVKIWLGTNGTTADTAIVNQNIAAAVGTAAADSVEVSIMVTWTATGSGAASLYWTIEARSALTAATGFSVNNATAFFSGTVASLTSTTSALIMGFSVASGTGTPTYVIPFIEGKIKNLG